MISLILAVALGQQGPVRVSTLTGNIQTHAAFHSDILTNERNVNVYLPPNYDKEPARHYPVLYMGDGQNLFDGATSFIPNQEWRADETAEALINAGLIEPIIIVGIDNAGGKRAEEYTPVSGKIGEYVVNAKGDDYGRFLTIELKPYIDKTYRTKTGPNDTALGGSSLGGLIALHLGVTTKTFGKIAAMSPSVWWANQFLVQETKSLTAKPKLRIWLDVGTAEPQEMLSGAQAESDALVAKGFKMGQDLTLFVDKGGKHNEDSWSRRFGMALMFLFKK